MLLNHFISSLLSAYSQITPLNKFSIWLWFLRVKANLLLTLYRRIRSSVNILIIYIYHMCFRTNNIYILCSSINFSALIVCWRCWLLYAAIQNPCMWWCGSATRRIAHNTVEPGIFIRSAPHYASGIRAYACARRSAHPSQVYSVCSWARTMKVG